MNKVILIGNLGADPEIRSTASTTVATLRVATNRNFTDSSGNNRSETEWHRCVAFGNIAQNAGKYLEKGKSVAIEGSIHYSQYEDKEGITRYSTEIRVSSIKYL